MFNTPLRLQLGSGALPLNNAEGRAAPHASEPQPAGAATVLADLLRNTTHLAGHLGAPGLSRLRASSRALRAAANGSICLAAATGLPLAQLDDPAARELAIRRENNRVMSQLTSLPAPHRLLYTQSGDYAHAQLALSHQGGMVAMVREDGRPVVLRPAIAGGQDRLVVLPERPEPGAAVLLKWSPVAPILLVAHQQSLACYAFDASGRLTWLNRADNPSGKNVPLIPAPNPVPHTFCLPFQRRERRAKLGWSPQGRFIWQHNDSGLSTWRFDVQARTLLSVPWNEGAQRQRSGSLNAVNEFRFLQQDSVLVAASPDVFDFYSDKSHVNNVTFYHCDGSSQQSWDMGRRLDLSPDCTLPRLYNNVAETHLLLHFNLRPDVLQFMQLDAARTDVDKVEEWRAGLKPYANRRLGLTPRPGHDDLVVSGYKDVQIFSNYCASLSPQFLVEDIQPAILGFRPTWSNDGRYLALTTKGALQVWDFGQAAKEPPQLHQTDHSDLAQGNIFFSPDSRFLAVGYSGAYGGSKRPTQQYVSLLNLDSWTYESHDLGGSSCCASIRDLFWHPQGGALGFAYDLRPGALHLRWMDVHSDRVDPCALGTLSEEEASQPMLRPQWSSCGSYLVWLSPGKDAEATVQLMRPARWAV